MSTIWFAATIVMKCRIDETPEDLITCFEQIHLIEADDGNSAFEKALLLGKSREHSYKNYQEKIVHWDFVGLQNLEEILDETIHDGIEICSRQKLVEDPQSLVRDKDRLTIFIAEKIRNKTAKEILSESENTEEN
jgi:hypothetical protein